MSCGTLVHCDALAGLAMLIIMAGASAQIPTTNISEHATGELKCEPINQSNKKNVFTIMWYKSLTKAEYTNGENAVLSWINGTIFPPDTNLGISSDFSLIIPNVSEDRAGIYRCLVYWTKGSDHFDVQLLVIDAPLTSTSPASMITIHSNSYATSRAPTSLSQACDCSDSQKTGGVAGHVFGYIFVIFATSALWVVFFCMMFKAVRKGFKRLFRGDARADKQTEVPHAEKQRTLNGELHQLTAQA